MAQWTETVTHLECDWCALPITFPEGKNVMNEEYSNDSCVCVICREKIEAVRKERCAEQKTHQLQNRPLPIQEKAHTAHYAPETIHLPTQDIERKTQELKDELTKIRAVIQRKIDEEKKE